MGGAEESGCGLDQAPQPEFSGSRDDVPVVKLANAVSEALRKFRATCDLCFGGPDGGQGEGNVGPPVKWIDIPTDGHFRVARPSVNGRPRHATADDKALQQREYGRYVRWAEGCGLDEQQLRGALASAPKARHQWCIAGIPEVLCEKRTIGQRGWGSARRHAVLECQALALQKAAAGAGREIGGETVAAEASAKMREFMHSFEACASQRSAVPQGWCVALGLQGDSREGCARRLPGLFEYWARGQGAALMGKEALARWRDVSVRAGRAQLPPSFAWSLDGEDFVVPDQKYINAAKLRRGEYPIVGAWCALAWASVLDEIDARFGGEHRLCFAIETEASQEQLRAWPMREVYVKLHAPPEDPAEAQTWILELHALHACLHEQMEEAADCPVCGDSSGARFRRDTRRPKIAWHYASRRSLWHGVVAAVRLRGTGWSSWRAVNVAGLCAPVPKRLQRTDIPIGNLEVLPAGGYRWGKYTTETISRDAAREELEQRWREDRQRRVAVLREIDERTSKDPYRQPGDMHILRSSSNAKIFQGRLWRDGEEWRFEEEGSGFRAVAEAPDGVQNRAYFAQRDLALYKAMSAEHAKAKAKAKKAAREASVRADTPSSVGEMAVKCKTSAGKLIYTWGDAERGRVEVEVTPRALRPPCESEASTYKAQAARESTPERALRKMVGKVRRVRAKAAKGQHQRIIAKVGGEPTHVDSGARREAEREEYTFSPALRKLDDPTSLAIARDAFEYLGTMRLHYCRNCDEEWPVFDGAWPQAGVAWAGAKAGSCETIERAGFKAAEKKPELCSRCASSPVYRKMYCEENLQHLGPRYPALSNLTWYESLLIARVHPVISVITLTATGLLCYAGHVCNYYVKVLDWFLGLPAVLKDKRWFFVKRRKSLRCSGEEQRQKKPTTANRVRLEEGIQEALKRMPNVYADSRLMPEEMAKFPYVGEREMLEQQDAGFVVLPIVCWSGRVRF